MTSLLLCTDRSTFRNTLIRYSDFVLPTKLLWDPLPNPLPAVTSTSFSGLRRRLEILFLMAAESRLPLDELVRLRVRRGIVQRLVRDAYQATVAGQDREHRRPHEFADAWRANLAFALDHADIDLSGSGPEAFTADDINLAWKLYEAASRGREQALGHVKLKHSQLTRMGSLKVPIFEILIPSGVARCVPIGRRIRVIHGHSRTTTHPA